MKRKILFLLLAASITLGSCHKSTCPTYDTGGGDGGTKGGSKTKTKSGVYPKKDAETNGEELNSGQFMVDSPWKNRIVTQTAV